MLVIFVLAVIPNPVFDVAGIAAGALRMPVLRYLGAAAAGKVIKNILVAGGASWFGDLLALQPFGA
jgi:membrane protein YqaA with SNARE-associated domain